ncbi:MAG: DinB family protein [Spirosomataceae bacterium]
MTEIETISKQTKDAYDWTNKLIHSIPFDKWDLMPKVIETTVSWQVGHLIVSHYYHSVMVIIGHQMDILQKIPLKEYNTFFTDGLPENAINKASPITLRNHLAIVQEKSLSIIKTLSVTEFNEKLVPTSTPHPIAQTKFEALDWNIKHTMYHCGQLGILKRVIDQRYDFSLRR